MVQVGDPLAPGRFLPFARNSLLLAACAGDAGGRCSPALLAWAAPAASRARRSGRRCAWPALGYAIPGSVIAVGTLVPLGLFDNALDGWMRARISASRPGCCCRAAWRRWSSPISCASWPSPSPPSRPASPASGPACGRPRACSARRPGAAVLRVELPLARGSLLTAFLLVFVDTMKELPATLIIRPFDFDTLAVRVHGLASDERLAEASTAALLIVVTGLLPVLALTRAMRRG